MTHVMLFMIFFSTSALSTNIAIEPCTFWTNGESSWPKPEAFLTVVVFSKLHS